MDTKKTRSVYDFSVETTNGETIKMDFFKGKTLLIVNTASKCGFTPQYSELEELYKKYHAKGLEVLAFPCNQFGGQEPGTNREIVEFCETNYGVSFPLFAKVEVNGPRAHPLFTYLCEALPGLLGSKAIKWNFTKFLVDKNGMPVKRFAPQEKPRDMDSEVRALL